MVFRPLLFTCFLALSPAVALSQSLAQAGITSGAQIASQRQLYTLADLEALEGTKSYEEFFEHAKDIRPSQRGDLWKKMMLSMGELYIKEASAKASIDQSSYKRILEIASWSPLAQDEFFAKKRNTFALTYLAQCLSEEGSKTDNCVAPIRDFFHSFGKEALLGVQIAQVIQKNAPPSEMTPGSIASLVWDFIAPMAKSPYGEFYCGKEPSYSAIIHKLKASITPEKIIHKDCLKAFGSTLKTNFSASKTPHTYLLMERLGLLNPQEKRKLLITQMLQGRDFENNKWEEALMALKEMGANPSSRKNLLSSLLKAERLPDGIFNIEAIKRENAQKRRTYALTRQLSKNFPEFLDTYTQQCLSWLSGEQDFKQGNPTPNCHQYFKMAKIIKSSPSPVTKRYDKIMNSWRR